MAPWNEPNHNNDIVYNSIKLLAVFDFGAEISTGNTMHHMGTVSKHRHHTHG